MGDELGDDPNVLQRAFRVRDAHHAVEEVDRAQLARVVVPCDASTHAHHHKTRARTVLAAGDGMQVEVDADAIFTCPLDGLEEVLPRDVCKERLAIACFDGPVCDGNANIVETSTGNLSEILFGLT